MTYICSECQRQAVIDGSLARQLRIAFEANVELTARLKDSDAQSDAVCDAYAKENQRLSDENAKHAPLIAAARAWYSMQSQRNITDLYQACGRLFGTSGDPTDNEE